MAPSSPTVANWALGLRLREKREDVGLTGGEAAKQIGIAGAYLSEVEHGKKNLAADRLDALIEVYGFNDDEAEELRKFREQATERGWWTKYSTLFTNPDLIRVFGLEHGAERIHSYACNIVAGMLQTEEYARAIIESGSPNLRLAETDRRLRCRLFRQRRLTDDDPVRFCSIMSEAVIRQQVGGKRVFKGQLEHLATLIDERPETIEVRIVPFEAAAHDALGGSAFILLGFPDEELPSVLWQESITSNLLTSDPTTIREYSIALAGATSASLSREESFELIRKTSSKL
ncbi:Helix-turn-helix domain-containing protein [Saccharopolyspora antimicrobica]|uniref:Helix-turn-helix domain-containing protein n=1 Tax=Saccharopolyspora antimicrobica TaxID=455193 RepID=A0A1I5G338_9PSEU|nr:helix-turn-helix transcriptional regulator [Saccharopolyspora antimicrobica]RKT83950.1 helix-turn-helix protein [Saccharopolyspora antimicrobica]SFO30374.1 Helix-turn-helix domain-containing protein [Saccharopolyspora antimicrobica]